MELLAKIEYLKYYPWFVETQLIALRWVSIEI